MYICQKSVIGNILSRPGLLVFTRHIAQFMRKTLIKIKNFFKVFGPGVITGAADDDPSGIATYTQTGAKFG